ncbi:MAG: hypothetical protein ACLFSG_03915, partial [Halothiobacillaceae bacterium]
APVLAAGAAAIATNAAAAVAATATVALAAATKVMTEDKLEEFEPLFNEAEGLAGSIWQNMEASDARPVR